MSNKSIIDRIEDKIQLVKLNQLDVKTFTKFFINSINALEGIPNTVIEDSRQIDYKLEISYFADEEDCISDLDQVIKELQEWLCNVKKLYC